MSTESIIRKYYDPKEGEVFYLYRTFSGNIIAMKSKVQMKEYIGSYVWPSKQMAAETEPVIQHQ